MTRNQTIMRLSWETCLSLSSKTVSSKQQMISKGQPHGRSLASRMSIRGPISGLVACSHYCVSVTWSSSRGTSSTEWSKSAWRRKTSGSLSHRSISLHVSCLTSTWTAIVRCHRATRDLRLAGTNSSCSPNFKASQSLHSSRSNANPSFSSTTDGGWPLTKCLPTSHRLISKDSSTTQCRWCTMWWLITTSQAAINSRLSLRRGLELSNHRPSQRIEGWDGS